MYVEVILKPGQAKVYCYSENIDNKDLKGVIVKSSYNIYFWSRILEVLDGRCKNQGRGYDLPALPDAGS
jgi:hypothetical protein